MSLPPTVLVHGGAGRVSPQGLPAHVAGCGKAAEAGLREMVDGKSALHAVVRAVVWLEDNPIYNAGTGASLREDGSIALDASLMDGAELRAGAVCNLPPFRNPILVAHSVMERSRHILLCGADAAAFAANVGHTPATLDAMRTERAQQRLVRWREGHVGEGWAGGTVGAVAIDAEGNVAAATSTGGTVGARVGRIGDSPILGAGTWADNTTGACSTTGIGEDIMRLGLARSAAEAWKANRHAQLAAQEAIDSLRRVDGQAGLIFVSATGELGIAKNTETMSHAVARLGQPLRMGH